MLKWSEITNDNRWKTLTDEQKLKAKKLYKEKYGEIPIPKAPTITKIPQVTSQPVSNITPHTNRPINLKKPIKKINWQDQIKTNPVIKTSGGLPQNFTMPEEYKKINPTETILEAKKKIKKPKILKYQKSTLKIPKQTKLKLSTKTEIEKSKKEHPKIYKEITEKSRKKELAKSLAKLPLYSEAFNYLNSFFAGLPEIIGKSALGVDLANLPTKKYRKYTSGIASAAGLFSPGGLWSTAFKGTKKIGAKVIPKLLERTITKNIYKATKPLLEKALSPKIVKKILPYLQKIGIDALHGTATISTVEGLKNSLKASLDKNYGIENVWKDMKNNAKWAAIGSAAFSLGQIGITKLSQQILRNKDLRLAAKILGVNKNSSLNDIKKAYYWAAKTSHPDMPGGSPEKWDAVSTAYNLLTKQRESKIIQNVNNYMKKHFNVKPPKSGTPGLVKYSGKIKKPFNALSPEQVKLTKKYKQFKQNKELKLPKEKNIPKNKQQLTGEKVEKITKKGMRPVIETLPDNVNTKKWSIFKKLKYITNGKGLNTNEVKKLADWKNLSPAFKMRIVSPNGLSPDDVADEMGIQEENGQSPDVVLLQKLQDEWNQRNAPPPTELHYASENRNFIRFDDSEINNKIEELNQELNQKLNKTKKIKDKTERKNFRINIKKNTKEKIKKLKSQKIQEIENFKKVNKPILDKANDIDKQIMSITGTIKDIEKKLSTLSATEKQDTEKWIQSAEKEILNLKGKKVGLFKKIKGLSVEQQKELKIFEKNSKVPKNDEKNLYIYNEGKKGIRTQETPKEPVEAVKTAPTGEIKGVSPPTVFDKEIDEMTDDEVNSLIKEFDSFIPERKRSNNQFLIEKGKETPRTILNDLEELYKPSGIGLKTHNVLNHVAKHEILKKEITTGNEKKIFGYGDLSNFTTMNGIFGHGGTDRFKEMIYKKFAKIVKKYDPNGRFGQDTNGDEHWFTVNVNEDKAKQIMREMEDYSDSLAKKKYPLNRDALKKFIEETELPDSNYVKNLQQLYDSGVTEITLENLPYKLGKFKSFSTKEGITSYDPIEIRNKGENIESAINRIKNEADRNIFQKKPLKGGDKNGTRKIQTLGSQKRRGGSTQGNVETGQRISDAGTAQQQKPSVIQPAGEHPGNQGKNQIFAQAPGKGKVVEKPSKEQAIKKAEYYFNNIDNLNSKEIKEAENFFKNNYKQLPKYMSKKHLLRTIFEDKDEINKIVEEIKKGKETVKKVYPKQFPDDASNTELEKILQSTKNIQKTEKTPLNVIVDNFVKRVKYLANAINEIEEGGNLPPPGRNIILDWAGNKQLTDVEATVLSKKIEKEIKEAMKGMKVGKPFILHTTATKNILYTKIDLIDKALAMYIDLKNATPEEIFEYLKSPNVSKMMKKVVQLAQNLPENFKKLADKYELVMKEMGKSAKKAGTIGNVREHWTYRFYEKQYNPDFNQKSWHKLMRKYKTILGAAAEGKKPYLVGLSNAVANTMRDLTKVLYNKNLIQTLNKAIYKIDEDGNIQKVFDVVKWDGYKKIEHPAFYKYEFYKKIEGINFENEKKAEFLKGNIIKDDGTVLIPKPLYAPKSVATYFNNILGTSALRKIPVVKQIMWLNDRIKRTILLYSGFHPIVLSLQHMLAAPMGWNPLKWFDKIPYVAYRKGLQDINNLTPEIKDLVKIGGLTLGQEIDIQLPGASQSRYTRWLFGKYAPGLKTFFALNTYHDSLNWWQKLHPNTPLPESKRREFLISASRQSNEIYGGLNWEKTGVNPGLWDAAKFPLFSPDWTISNTGYLFGLIPIRKEVKDFVIKKMKDGKPPDNITPPADWNAKWKVDFRDSMRHLKTFLRIAANMVAITVMGNLFINHRPFPQNVTGRKNFAIEITKLVPKNKRTKGKRYFIYTLASFGDPLRYAEDLPRTLYAKSSWLSRVWISLLTKRNWAGQPYTTAKKFFKTGKYVGFGKTQKGWSTMPSFLFDRILTSTPIPVQAATEYLMGVSSGTYAITRTLGLPVSRTYIKKIESNPEKLGFKTPKFKTPKFKKPSWVKQLEIK